MTIGRRLCVGILLLFFGNFVFASLQFDSINSVVYLQDNAASVRIATPTLIGWVNTSIQRKIRGFNDYDLKSYDVDNNDVVSYTEVPPAEFVFYDYTVAANTVQHVTQDTVFDLGGKYFKFEDYAQLFVDTDVTVTIRNATIRYEATYPTFPPIRLASHGSKIAFDNVTMLLSDDFHFLQGQLFVHNNFTMVGNNAFVYNSPKPSFIASGASWKFDTGSTFSVAPATFTDAPYTLKNTYTDCNFIKMAASSSQLSLNGCSLMTTYTGLRLTNGNVLCDNAVSCVSDATITVTGWQPKKINEYGLVGVDAASAVSWRPDGQYLAVGGFWALGKVKVYQFDGTSFTEFADPGYGGDDASSVVWSPDGQYLAVGGQSSSGNVKVYKFDGTSFTEQFDPGFEGLWAQSVSWSPDGKYLAVGGRSFTTSHLKIYRFDGNRFTTLPDPQFDGTRVNSVAWSPDGQYLAVGGIWSSNYVKVYRFDGTSFTSLAVADYGDEAFTISWSPDGRYLAVAGFWSGNKVRVYRFDGSNFMAISGPDYIVGASSPAYSVSWSPDGKYLAVAGDRGGGVNNNDGTLSVGVYSFDGTSFTELPDIGYGDYSFKTAWHPDGTSLVVDGFKTNMFVVLYPCAFGSETTSQATSSSIIFGDSAKGSAFDVSVQFANNAVVRPTHGKLVYDCVD